MEDLIRKIQIHLETTEECMENTSLPQYVVELLEQDNELLGEVVNKYQAERSYSEEEVISLLNDFAQHLIFSKSSDLNLIEWFEQIKKK
jgi:hemerythrin